jgi:class 3 adenylate cyclase
MLTGGLTPMTIICRSCSHANLVTDRFCGACGANLESIVPRESSLSQAFDVPSKGERRILTVVFADLVGSTQLVDILDPEDLIDLMATYQTAVTAVAERHRGHVSAYLGDGMRILFGHPIAQEDAAHAAVRASLEIVEVINRIGREVVLPENLTLQVRVGVSTGIVVASPNAAVDRIEDGLIGASLNLAARLQHVAAPNQVVISESTYNLIASAFACRDLGLHDLKGFHQTMRVFSVLRGIRGKSRIARRLQQTRTPMVNRDAEQGILLERWKRARSGNSEFVCIFGEAGIGKSRLATALAERTEGDSRIALWMQCDPTLVNTAFHPHIELIERLCAIEPDDEPAVRVRKLSSFLRDEGEEDPESLALVGAMLSIPPNAELPQLSMSQQLQKQRTFDVLVSLLVKAAWRTPVLLVYEDLHWIDPSSHELATQIANRAGSTSLLVVGTSRPGKPSPWCEGENVTTLHLGRLNDSESAKMVSYFRADTSLPPTLVARIVERTDGVPLFIEEMTRMVIDSGGENARSNLPETLRDLLSERLDRLGNAKRIAQIGSVIGREFSVALVASLLSTVPDSLTLETSKLLETGLVETRDPDTLMFKHALVQDAAYTSLLTRDRRQLHAQVASRLVADDREGITVSPELVARHLKAAGELLDASHWWLRAGVQAIQRGAASEAITHLESGLEGLSDLPLNDDRQRAELELLAVLGPAQMVKNGPGSSFFGDVQRRAFATMQIISGRPRQFPVTYGLALFHWGRAEFDFADQLASELIVTARAQPTAEHIMAGNNISSMVRFHRGKSLESCDLLRKSVGLYDPAQHHDLYPRYLMDFGVFGRFYLALSCFVAGDAPTARIKLSEAMPLAVELRQPHSRGFAMLANFLVACFRRDLREAEIWSERCIEYSGEQGFPEFVAMATIVRGWTISRQGAIVEGLRMLEQGIALWNTTGFETWQSWFGALRGELLLAVGRSGDALEEVAIQEDRIARNGEMQFASILASIKAQALERVSLDAKLVDDTYSEAMQIARMQGAIAWQLQIAATYARWLRERDRRGEAEAVVDSAITSLPAGVTPQDLKADWIDSH